MLLTWCELWSKKANCARGKTSFLRLYSNLIFTANRWNVQLELLVILFYCICKVRKNFNSIGPVCHIWNYICKCFSFPTYRTNFISLISREILFAIVILFVFPFKIHKTLNSILKSIGLNSKAIFVESNGYY